MRVSDGCVCVCEWLRRTVVLVDELCEFGVLKGKRCCCRRDGSRWRRCHRLFWFLRELPTFHLFRFGSPGTTLRKEQCTHEKRIGKPVLIPDLRLALAHAELLADLPAADSVWAALGGEEGLEHGQLLWCYAAALSLFCWLGGDRYP